MTTPMLPLGTIVRSNRAAIARRLRTEISKITDTGWIGIVLEYRTRDDGVLLVRCGQRPEPCRCHLERGEDRPEVSDPRCLDCDGDGEAFWSARRVDEVEAHPDQTPCPGLTRELPDALFAVCAA